MPVFADDSGAKTYLVANEEIVPIGVGRSQKTAKLDASKKLLYIVFRNYNNAFLQTLDDSTSALLPSVKYPKDK